MASADGSIEFQTNDFADIFAVAAEDQRQAGVWRDSDTSKFDVVHEESAFEPPTEDMISANKKSLGPGDMTREWVYAALKDKTGLELKGPAFVGKVAEESAIGLYRDAISFYDAETRHLHVPKGGGKAKLD